MVAAAAERERGARDEKLEEYQMKVERMQRMMEEERLVGESKIRQLVEQNEALRRHLKLALDSLRNPIAIAQPPEEGDTGKENREPEAEKEEVIAVPEPEEGEGEAGVQDGVWCDAESMREKTERDAVEMQERMEELLKDLGLFKRKVADDHQRFGVTKGRPSRPLLREVRAN